MYDAYEHKKQLLGRRFVLTGNTTHYDSEDIQRILAYGHEEGPKLAEAIHEIQAPHEAVLSRRAKFDHMATCVAGCRRIRYARLRESYSVVLKYTSKHREIIMRTPSSSMFALIVPKLNNWLRSDEATMATLGASCAKLPQEQHRELVFKLLSWNMSYCVNELYDIFLLGHEPKAITFSGEAATAYEKMMALRLSFLEAAVALGPVRINRTAAKLTQAQRQMLNVELMQSVGEAAEQNLMASSRYLDKTAMDLARLKRSLPAGQWQFEELLSTVTQMRDTLRGRFSQVKRHVHSLSAHPHIEQE